MIDDFTNDDFWQGHEEGVEEGFWHGVELVFDALDAILDNKSLEGVRLERLSSEHIATLLGIDLAINGLEGDQC